MIALRRWILALRIEWLEANMVARVLVNRNDGARRDKLRAQLEELNLRASRQSAQREINRIARRRDLAGQRAELPGRLQVRAGIRLTAKDDTQ